MDYMELMHSTPNLDWLLCTKYIHQWYPRMLEISKNPTDRSAVRLAAAWLNGTPPSNIWVGCTAENQRRYDERTTLLFLVPAKVRFVSAEPLLGDIDMHLNGCAKDRLHWVITGPETGKNARVMQPKWAESLFRQTQEAGIAFWFGVVKAPGGLEYLLRIKQLPAC